MRIHTLTLEAFGPFPGREHIDFDELSDAGILLIHGPTGAGKTSLLDAVSFGLFGDVAGARNAQRQSLRSHHAPPHARPWVTVEFSVGNQRWRVERSPQWDAPKKRGTGTTPRQASVLVSKYTSDQRWEAVTTRLPEAAELMTDVLGMGLAQFSQVVLLPQGEFAQFLRAKPDERRALLERLFDVSRFERIEEWFAQQRADRGREIDQLEAAITTQLDVVRQATQPLSDESLEVPVWEPRAPEIVTEELRSLIARVRERSETEAERAEQAAAGAQGAERALTHAKATAQRKTQFVDACHTLATISPSDIAARQSAIERAVSAGALAALEKSHTSALDQVISLRADVDDTCAALEALGTAPDVEVVELRARLTLLRDEAREAERAIKATDALATSHAQGVATRLAHAEATAQVLQAKADYVKNEVRHHAAEETFAALVDPAPVKRDVRRFATGLSQLAPAQRAVDAAAQGVARAAADAVSAENELSSLRRQRLATMAGELSASLVPDEPCPVCGSTAHPQPAPVVDAEQLDSEIEHADAAAAEKRSALATAQAKASSAQAALDSQRTVAERLADELREAYPALPWPEGQVLVSGDASDALAKVDDAVNETEAAYAQAQGACQAAQSAFEQARTRLWKLETALAQRKADERTARERVRERHADLTRAVSTLSQRDNFPLPPIDGDTSDANALDSALEILKSDIAAHRREAVADAESLERTIALAEKLTGLQARLVDATASSQRAGAAWSSALEESPFDTADEVHTAVLSSGELAARRTQLDELRRRRSSAQATADDPETRIAAFTPSADLARLRDRAAVLERQAQSQRNTSVTWLTALSSLDTLRNQLADNIRRYSSAAASAREIRALAETFNGGGENTHRMRLTSYVLASYLETVTTMANERLALMSDGRYQLRHTDERAARGAHSGLGLAVVDSWTGQSRNTATLSGGEAFMASLALALGLGDAVRADSGGMELHTLFVDEGFGSLDPETLEEVMQVLDDLREGGRLVGIVSHVTELKSRIPTHIEVRKTSEGSTLRGRASSSGEAAAS